MFAFIGVSQVYLPFFSPEADNRRKNNRNGVMVEGKEMLVENKGLAVGGMWKNMNREAKANAKLEAEAIAKLEAEYSDGKKK